MSILCRRWKRPFNREDVVSGKGEVVSNFEFGDMGEKASFVRTWTNGIDVGNQAISRDRVGRGASGGARGLRATIKLTLVGRINQTPGGRWQWLSAPYFELIDSTVSTAFVRGSNCRRRLHARVGRTGVSATRAIFQLYRERRRDDVEKHAGEQ